jgi:DNA-binding NtrC family response regulator
VNTQTQSIVPLAEHPNCVSPTVLPANGPIQFLIIDKANGPADVVFDVFGRLVEFGVTLTLANTREDMLYALNCYKIDLLVLGLENHLLETLALVPNIRKEYPDLRIMAIGHNLSPFQMAQCQQFGVEDVLEMPHHASELKALLRALLQRYVLE